MQRKSIIERAFELAQSSDCHSLSDIKRILNTEHYANIDAHMTGPALRKQLHALMH